jgi:hypothetical protein
MKAIWSQGNVMFIPFQLEVDWLLLLLGLPLLNTALAAGHWC